MSRLLSGPWLAGIFRRRRDEADVVDAVDRAPRPGRALAPGDVVRLRDGSELVGGRTRDADGAPPAEGDAAVAAFAEAALAEAERIAAEADARLEQLERRLGRERGAGPGALAAHLPPGRTIGRRPARSAAGFPAGAPPTARGVPPSWTAAAAR